MSLLLALLVQVGPAVSGTSGPVSPLPPEVQQRQAIERQRAAAAPTKADPARPAPDTKLGECLAAIREDPAATAEAARAWLDAAKGPERAAAGQCLGSALVALGRFGEARLELQAALGVLDVARADAGAAADPRLASGIAADRARALVALKREPEAAAALADARASDPANPNAWLLAATLSRRQGKLAEAQAQIERAAQLLPIDPEIGLEAGVIAVLAGHEAAARKSWQSVVAAAPRSAAAQTAQAYLAQLDAPTGSNP